MLAPALAVPSTANATSDASAAIADVNLIRSHPFLEGRVGWPGTGLLASGLDCGAFPGNRRLPSGLATAPEAAAERTPFGFGPVTVAGPHRLFTGLPLTTDRYERGNPTPAQKKGAARRPPLSHHQVKRVLTSSSSS